MKGPLSYLRVPYYNWGPIRVEDFRVQHTCGLRDYKAWNSVSSGSDPKQPRTLGLGFRVQGELLKCRETPLTSRLNPSPKEKYKDPLTAPKTCPF